MPDPKIHIHWFRRDLRLNDHSALSAACQSGFPILPVFIFDPKILHYLPKKDQRVHFIHQTLCEIKKQLENRGSTLKVYFDTPIEAWKKITSEYDVQSVSVVRDYEPYAQKRDKAIHAYLKDKSIEMKGYKDQVIFEKNEITKDDGGYYAVFTPYRKQWEKHLTDKDLQEFPINLDKFHKSAPKPMIGLSEMGFEKTDPIHFPTPSVSDAIIEHYDQKRDIPSIRGTSRLSVHLRFGTVSIRALAKRAKSLNHTFLNELIWREFYQMTMYHNPQSATKAIKPAYDNIEWENNEQQFEAWCAGKTGYPLVDAGMRELNTTGFMHNRIRMLTASFLTKHLLIDWRWGERYFAEKLLDFDLASNVGGWQWAAGCGNDAAPYFRIFNPHTQLKKFDPKLEYVQKFVTEYGTPAYPGEIIEHKVGRERALERYKLGLNGR
ncbi:MAG: deoxyribodipyrimidine photo-lyase [Cryomorphaceae bacterium]|nr:deoxyribodipyrimidine photo-lyase [Cryomorphaceae bacterium]